MLDLTKIVEPDRVRREAYTDPAVFDLEMQRGVGETDDIAPAAVFFASDDSKWVTGETLLIAGGLR